MTCVGERFHQVVQTVTEDVFQHEQVSVVFVPQLQCKLVAETLHLAPRLRMLVYHCAKEAARDIPGVATGNGDERYSVER